MAEVLKILLSGPGLIGTAHAARIAERDDCVVAGIVAPGLPEHVAFASAIGAPLSATIEEALARGSYDGAIVSSPNVHHRPQALACIAAGLPTLVEKPLADDIDSAAAIVEAAEGSHVPVMVGHHRAHSPSLIQAKAFVTAPEFGRLVTVQGSALFYKPAEYFAAGPWRTQPGGGPALINLIHEIGILRFLCGEIETVFAYASDAVRGFPVEDTMAIGLRFRNNCLGTFILSDTAASSKSWEMTSGENPAYPFHGDEFAYHIAGTNGSLDIPSMRGRLYSSEAPPSWWRPFEEVDVATRREDPLRRQIAHFLAVIRGEASPVVSARDGYNNMLVLDAILRAAREGRSVAVAR